jgi:effector-binding domain-containing protein
VSRSIASSILAAIAISLVAVAAAKADGPATQPTTPQASAPPAAAPANAGGEDQDFVVSQMRVQEMKGIHFAFISSKCATAQLGDNIRQSMEKIGPMIKSGQLRPAGPALIIYHGMGLDPISDYPLEVGFPVARDTQAAGDIAVKDLDKFRCATVLYSGHSRHLRDAYMAVFHDLNDAGLEPTDESRQAILLFEGEDSVNNVSMIQIGVK